MTAPARQRLKRDLAPTLGPQPTLTTAKVVFMIAAAAALMAGVVGSLPLAFAIGNGARMPASFALAGLILLTFSVGYAAIGRIVIDAGGFYAYIRSGLGSRASVGCGLVAVVSYCAATIGVTGAFSCFVNLTFASAGVTLPWPIAAAFGVCVTGFLGYRRTDLSARLLAFLLSAEVLVLLISCGAIVFHKGSDAFPRSPFSSEYIFDSHLGVGLMFFLLSFVGFDAAAIYGEDTRGPPARYRALMGAPPPQTAPRPPDELELSLQFPDPAVGSGEFAALNAGPSGPLPSVDEVLGVHRYTVASAKPSSAQMAVTDLPARTSSTTRRRNSLSYVLGIASSLQWGLQPVSQNQVKYWGPDQNGVRSRLSG